MRERLPSLKRDKTDRQGISKNMDIRRFKKKDNIKDLKADRQRQ